LTAPPSSDFAATTAIALRIGDPQSIAWDLPVSQSWGIHDSAPGEPTAAEIYRAWGLDALLSAPSQRSPDAPGDSAAAVAGLLLPATISVVAGQTTSLRIRVPGRDTSMPLRLEFRKLPPGISMVPSAVALAAETVDLVLSASDDAPPGSAEASVVCTVGTRSDEARFVVNVLPPPPSVIFERGQAELARGALDNAAAAFTTVNRLDPGAFDARRYRGEIRERQARYQEALADYTAMILLRPRHAEAYRKRADLFARLGEHARADADRNTFVWLSQFSDRGFLR
jgi:tetratricopeptide (TPR) repeat protein